MIFVRYQISPPPYFVFKKQFILEKKFNNIFKVFNFTKSFSAMVEVGRGGSSPIKLRDKEYKNTVWSEVSRHCGTFLKMILLIWIF